MSGLELQDSRVRSLVARLAPRETVIVVGAAVVDLVIRVPRLPGPGDDVEACFSEQAVGGCAWNVAVALHRLGARVELAVPVGVGPWSDFVRAAMREEGLASHLDLDPAATSPPSAAEAEHVGARAHPPQVPGAATGDCGWSMALVLPDGERSFVSVSGVESEWSEALLSRVPLPDTGWVYVSGYELASRTGNALLTWLERACRGLRIVVDPGPRAAAIPQPVLDRLWRMQPWLNLNAAEAIALSGCDRVEDACVALHQCTGAPVIVHAGGDGAFVIDNPPERAGGARETVSGADDGDTDLVRHVPAFPAKVVDTVGAGDAHTGGVLAGLAAGMTCEEAAVIANLVASVVVSHPGPGGAPRIAELREMAESSRWRRPARP